MTHDILYDNLSLELEQEYSNRIDEIMKMENFVEYNKETTNEEVLGIIRKSMILVLYSHFEGYCKQVLQYYVVYLNKEKVSACNVKFGLMAANMYKEFRRLSDGNHKPVDLHHLLKEDAILQQYGRRREFIGHFDTIMAKEINISEDFVDTESNLRPHVLKKLLFQLELDYSIVDAHQNDINRLVNVRNCFAHGDRITYPTEKEYNEYKQAVVGLMEKLKTEIEQAYYNRAYLKVSS